MSKALAPIIGLIALVVAGAGAFFLSTPIETLLLENIAGLPINGTMQIVAGIGIFVLILMVFGLLYALIAPKPKTVHESELKREIDARRANQKQQRKTNRKQSRR